MGRTGTMSLKLALERLLGAPCYHMMEVFPRPQHFALWAAAGRGERVDWRALLHGFAATVDWPSAAFWEELAAEFPDAIILHSERDPEAWWKSAHATIFKPRAEPRPPGLAMMLDSIFATRFTLAIEDKAAAIAAYRRNNEHVRATAPRSRLVLWTPDDGWAPLCRALGVPEPAEPFPHANTTDEFNARIGGPPHAPPT